MLKNILMVLRLWFGFTAFLAAFVVTSVIAGMRSLPAGDKVFSSDDDRTVA